MPESWKNVQITAGSLVAFVAGLFAVGATVVSVQSWLDDRIDQRVDPVKAEVEQLSRLVSEQIVNAEQTRSEQYEAIERRLKELER